MYCASLRRQSEIHVQSQADGVSLRLVLFSTVTRSFVRGELFQFPVRIGASTSGPLALPHISAVTGKINCQLLIRSSQREGHNHGHHDAEVISKPDTATRA